MPRVQLTCQQCGKLFDRLRLRIKKRTFCSKPCAYAGLTKKDNKTRRMLRLPQHPLATKNGYVAEHRKILYDSIGSGPHACRWCRREVRWLVRSKCKPEDGELVVDHLDNNPLNNSLENLVPSCQPCNGVRSRKVEDSETYITRRNGTRLRAEKRSCHTCGKGFLFAPSSDCKPNAGKYCSQVCLWRRSKQ